MSVFTGTVPIDPWRQGDFSTLRNASGQPITIFDPATGHADPANASRFIRDPFAGNRIPISRLDPVGASVIKYFPEPNVTPTNPNTNANNYTVSGTGPVNSHRVDTRLDHNVSDKWRIFGRVSTAWNDSISFSPFANAASPNVSKNNGRQISVSLDQAFSISPSLIANVRYGLGRSRSNGLPLSDGFDITSIGFPRYVYDVAKVQGLDFPAFSFAGSASSLGDTWTRANSGVLSHSLTGSLTKIITGHTFKAGAEWRKLFMNFGQYGFPSGSYQFDSAWTQQEINTSSSAAGFPLGSFLLGLPTYNASLPATMTHDPATATASSYYALFFQDDWKISSKLTVNIGVRYDLELPRTERYNRMSTFDLSASSPLQGKLAGAACRSCGNLRGAFTFMDNSNRTQVPVDNNNFGPRVGLAYSLTPKTVIRTGYGISYAPSAYQAAGNSGGIGLDGYRTTTSMMDTLDSMRTIAATLSDPYPNGFNLPPGRSLGALTSLGLNFYESILGGYRTPYNQQWNFNVQRQLPGQLVIEAGYLGNRGVHLIDGDGMTAVNQLPASDMSLGSQLQTMVPNPFYGIVTNPLSPLSRATVQYSQLLRPYPQYTDLDIFRKPTADSIYHAMTVRADKRFGKGLSLLMAYTAGKLIDNSSQAVKFLGTVAYNKLDGYNRRLERAVSSIDVSQRLVLSYVYQLPFGKGQALLANLPRGANLIVSGWQANGITTFQTGTPVIVTSPQNNTGIYTFSQRPNNNGHSADVSGGTTDQRLARWFDTSVFSLPAPYTFGNAPRTLPDVRNPGLKTTDLSVFKNNFFGPEGRLNLQYRLEMFNAFNTPQWGPPGGAVGSGSFGIISSTAVAPRQVQMALKLLW